MWFVVEIHVSQSYVCMHIRPYVCILVLNVHTYVHFNTNHSGALYHSGMYIIFTLRM